MTWEPRPLPEPSPETEAFWQACADGWFALAACESCDLVFYYPRARCPDCFSADVSLTEAKGTGTVYTYAATEHVEGWPDEALPLVVAMIELAEGPKVMSNIIDCDPSAVEIGMDVEVTFVDTEDDGIGIPVFRPIDE